jgi:hypothetical protein
MNIYLLIYIILIIILIFIIINFYLLKQNNKKNIFEKFGDVNNVSIDQSVFKTTNSNSFPDGEDPGKALSDLKLPDTQKQYEETINTQSTTGNAQRPPVILQLSSSKESSTKSSTKTDLYQPEITQQTIQKIDTSNLPVSSKFSIVNRIKSIEEEHRIPNKNRVIEEECCKKPSPKLHDQVCGNHYDTCRIDEEGNDSCCDSYTCLRPNGNFGQKKCLDSSDIGFNLRVPDVDTTGYYDLTIPKTDFNKLRIPGIDISNINIPGFNISDIGIGLSKLNPLNINTCDTGKHTYNKWTGKVTENPSSSVSSVSSSFFIPSKN